MEMEPQYIKSLSTVNKYTTKRMSLINILLKNPTIEGITRLDSSSPNLVDSEPFTKALQESPKGVFMISLPKVLALENNGNNMESQLHYLCLTGGGTFPL